MRGKSRQSGSNFLFTHPLQLYKLLIIVSKLESLHGHIRINACNPNERPEPTEIPGIKKVNTQQVRSLAVS